MSKHNYAAFSRADLADAKRGRPEFDLQAYAAGRGIEFLDHMTIAGFGSAMPREPEWQHNVLHGELPGGGFGVLLHEGLAMEWPRRRPAWSGSYGGSRIATGDGGWFRDFVRGVVVTSLPGMLRSILIEEKDPPPARIPCTVAAVRVPEARGVFPKLRIDRRRSTPPYNFGNQRDLNDVGLPGWHMWSAVEPPTGLVQALLASPAADGLRAHDDAGLYQVVSWYGILLVRRNGYVGDADALDEMATTASLLAERLRAACQPMCQPQPVDQPLEPAATGRNPREMHEVITDPWSQWALATSRQRGLELEDPDAYHRAFPRVPVPGVARAVMRGNVAPFGMARLVIHREENAARPAVVVPAPPGMDDTPAGGLRFPDRQARVEVSDGLLAVWSTTSYCGSAMAGDIDEFLARAADVAREACPAVVA